MAELYWIRHPDHTDMFSQGYVGITKHTASKRYRGHLKDTFRKDRKANLPIHNAIRKYKDVLIVQTLCIGEIDYIKNLENTLRPSFKIGWNIDIGGSTGKTTPTPHSESSKILMSEKRKELYKDPSYADKRAKMVLSKFTPDMSYLNGDGSPKRFWSTRYRKGASPALWENIPELWYFYQDNKMSFARQAIQSSSFYKPENIIWVRKIINYFRSGWKPLEDVMYLEDFPIENK